MGGYVIYIDGFMDLARARSHKMARARGWINGEVRLVVVSLALIPSLCRLTVLHAMQI